MVIREYLPSTGYFYYNEISDHQNGLNMTQQFFRLSHWFIISLNFLNSEFQKIFDMKFVNRKRKKQTRNFQNFSYKSFQSSETWVQLLLKRKLFNHEFAKISPQVSKFFEKSFTQIYTQNLIHHSSQSNLLPNLQKIIALDESSPIFNPLIKRKRNVK